jgi:hypothetical protein
MNPMLDHIDELVELEEKGRLKDALIACLEVRCAGLEDKVANLSVG